MNDALLTGLPRSGTTISCELLNRLPDAVALDEPMRHRDLMGFPAPTLGRRIVRKLPLGSLGEPVVSREGAVHNIGEFLAASRRSLLQDGVATSKHVDGQVFGGKVADTVTETGLRKKLADKGTIQIDKQLTPEFTLAVKHNSAFTALLPNLVGSFRVFAIVRNPLATLISWQSVPFRIREGHVPYGEKLDPELATALGAIDDRVDRQLHVLAWFFAHFDADLSRDAVIRYEDLMASGGKALAVVTPQAESLAEPLQNRNRTGDDARELADRLLERDGAFWNFYSRDSVEALVTSAGAGT